MDTTIAPIPESLDNVTIGDIPIKYFNKDKNFLPYVAQMHATFNDFRVALNFCKTAVEEQKSAILKKLDELFVANPMTERCFPSLSVRSCFDNYLQVRKFPRGSEIIMTAVTIPDMVSIVEKHGLVPVPVDLELETMQPRLDQIKAATSPQTVAIIFAMVYGVTYSLDPYADYLHAKGIEIIEDCAQSFSGVHNFRGSKHALLTMFSFGTIKNPTAFYGSINVVRDISGQNQHHLFKQMSMVQNSYPVYSAKEYKKKIQKGIIFWVLTMKKAPMYALNSYMEYTGQNIEDFLVSMVRGFNPNEPNFLQKFRIQPCAPLLAMLHHVCSNYTELHHAKRLKNHETLAKELNK